MGNVELKPCPFCGAEVAIVTNMHDLKECENFKDESCPCEQYEEVKDCRYYIVVCNVRMGGCGSSSGYFLTEELAIQTWNNRV